MEQLDSFGVPPEGILTPDDISDLAIRLMAKDIQIARLKKRIAELTTAPAQVSEQQPLENGTAAVEEAAEIVQKGAKA